MTLIDDAELRKMVTIPYDSLRPGPTSYTCWCGESFRSVDDLEAHMVTVWVNDGLSQLQCPNVGRVIRTEEVKPSKFGGPVHRELELG